MMPDDIPDDGRGSIIMLAWCEILLIIIFLAAVGYFGGRALYYAGYEAKKSDRAACMSYILDSEEKCLNRCGK